MKTKIVYNGKEYEFCELHVETKEKMAELITARIKYFDSYKMELPNGDFLIMGKEAVQKAVFIITD